MSDLPVPDTKEALLVSAGNNQYTAHVFDHTEEVPFTDYRGKPDGSVLAFVFKCTETGKLRRWGNAQ